MARGASVLGDVPLVMPKSPPAIVTVSTGVYQKPVWVAKAIGPVGSMVILKRSVAGDFGSGAPPGAIFEIQPLNVHMSPVVKSISTAWIVLLVMISSMAASAEAEERTSMSNGPPSSSPDGMLVFQAGDGLSTVVSSTVVEISGYLGMAVMSACGVPPNFRMVPIVVKPGMAYLLCLKQI